MPTLDVPSVAQLVTFSVLCLYHMRRWSNIIVLCRGFNDATCSVYATTFLPLMIGASCLAVPQGEFLGVGWTGAKLKLWFNHV
ncbi:unnamed protein product [Cladocopium goreaui]|uniref:Uncharacterized protein n=1 Tax=Cladocopium goreaui TaxID=2562237 RepID=A0A9P1FV87_9DINO|nr:unnamed protein product [Cladocopium goreaui]